MSQASLPLRGVRVLDLTRFPPGAYITVLLSDLGADVWHVEAPNAQPFMYGIGTGLGRGKRSVGVNLRHERGVEVLRRLAAQVDVVVENEMPGVMDDRGFGYTHAASELPSLIWCSITGFGQDGPAARWPGHDVSYLAHSGLLTAAEPNLPWEPQQILAIPLGGLLATVGILGALRERDTTGTGGQIDISISEAATWALSSSDGEINGDGFGIPYGPDRKLFQCADDRWIALAASDQKSWRALCIALDIPDLADALHRWDDPAAVVDRLAVIFRTRPAAEWVAELGPAGAAIVPVNRGTDLANDPHIAARGTLQQIGDQLVPRNPIRVRDAGGERPTPTASPVSQPGADTDEVLDGAGFGPDEIAELRAAGVIGE